jgi:hypothetical protein
MVAHCEAGYMPGTEDRSCLHAGGTANVSPRLRRDVAFQAGSRN